MSIAVSQLSVDRLNVVYRAAGQRRHAVDDVSFVVAPGESLGLVGESGCGKSTLAMALLGLLDPELARTRANSVRLGDIDLFGPGADAARSQTLGKRIGVIFQNPLVALNPVLTIGRQMMDHMRWHLKLSAEASRERAAALLSEVGIVDAAHRLAGYPHELSGGMLQRVTIAMALACEPELLIADEPTTALDATVQAEIVDLILALRRSRGLGLIWITHDLALLTRIADRVAVMYAGRIVEIGSIAQIYNRPSHPYTRALLASVRSMWEESKGPFRTIPSAPLGSDTDLEGCAFRPRCAHQDKTCASRPSLVVVGEADHEVACWRPVAEGGT